MFSQLQSQPNVFRAPCAHRFPVGAIVTRSDPVGWEGVAGHRRDQTQGTGCQGCGCSNGQARGPVEKGLGRQLILWVVRLEWPELVVLYNILIVG